MTQLVKDMRAITYVNCWHVNERESAAMWKIYLKSNEGLAILSTVGRLKESIKEFTEFDVYVQKVNYVDFNTFDIPVENLLSPYFHKRKSFEYEQELRALIWGPQNGKMDFKNTQAAPSGLLVLTNLTVLVDSINASPTAEKWFVELLKIDLFALRFNEGSHSIRPFQ